MTLFSEYSHEIQEGVENGTRKQKTEEESKLHLDSFLRGSSSVVLQRYRIAKLFRSFEDGVECHAVVSVFALVYGGFPVQEKKNLKLSAAIFR